MKTLQNSALAAMASLLFVSAGPLATPQEIQEAAAPQQASILPVLRATLNRPAPEFTLTDTDGKTHRLAALKGQVVVLEWYNPDCPVVRQAHSKEGVLVSLGNRTDKLENVTWLAINSGAVGAEGHGKERNAESRLHYGLDYPVLLDESGQVGRKYGATTTPQMYIIDKDGILVYMGGHDDRKTGDLIAPAIAQAIKGEKPTPARTGNRGCSVKYPTKATLGAVSPLIKLEDLDGNMHDLNNFAGKVVVLEWFNPNCPVVVAAHETGPLQTAAADLTRSGQVVWLGVNSGGKEDPSSKKQVNADMAKKWNLNHPILMDPTGKWGKKYGARVTPQMFILDTNGVLVYEGSAGEAETPHVKSIVTRLLKGEKVTPSQTDAQGCSVKYSKDAGASERGKKGRKGGKRRGKQPAKTPE